MNGAAALKCDVYRFEFSLAGYLDKSNVHWRGGLVCEYKGECAPDFEEDTNIRI